MHLASATEIREQFCLPFQKGTKFHRLSKFLVDERMDGLIPTTDQPFRNFCDIVLTGIVQDQNALSSSDIEVGTESLWKASEQKVESRASIPK